MKNRNSRLSNKGRQDKLIKERDHDPYRSKAKPPEPTQCSGCSAVFKDGRWQWMEEVPRNPHTELCPACQRIRDRVPAGILTLRGDFFDEHHDEIVALIRNKVEAENRQHPMKRMMAMERDGENTVITFTDTHLPRGVGSSIESAYQGELEIQYTPEAGIVRVNWRR